MAWANKGRDRSNTGAAVWATGTAVSVGSCTSMTAGVWQTCSQSELCPVPQQSKPPGAEKLGPVDGPAGFVCIWQDFPATSGLACRAWQGWGPANKPKPIASNRSRERRLRAMSMHR